VIYWVTTGLIAALSLFAASVTCPATRRRVEGFAHVVSAATPDLLASEVSGAIVLVVPGIARVKEWAYAGFGVAWIAASVRIIG